MKILFIYPDFTVDIDPKTHRYQGMEEGGWYMEGLASMSAVLKGRGHDVSLYHMVRPADRETFTRRVKQEAPDLIGFTTFTRPFPYVAEEYAPWAKEATGTPIIVGGVHANSFPEEVADIPAVDLVAVGEAEDTIVELCDRLGARKPLGDLAGAWVKSDGTLTRNSCRPLIHDLDALPLPDFELFDFDLLIGTKIGSAAALLARGCPYTCSYCVNPRTRSLYDDKKHYWRMRSPQRAIEYLEKLMSVRPDFQVIHFCDDILAPSVPWLAEFVEMYKRKIHRPFTCNQRVNFMNRDLVRLLKEAGCYTIFAGIENGNDYIRNRVLNRGMNRDKIIEAFRLSEEAGITTVAYNMLGVPFETNKTMLETIKLNAEARADVSLRPTYFPFPGTPLFDVAVKEGFVPAKYDYRENRYLEQPTLSEGELRFARYYFRIFMRGYRWAFRLSDPWKGRVERALDAVFLWKWLPRRPLAALSKFTEDSAFHFKNWLRERMPGVYRFLRNRLRRVKRTAAPAAA